MAISGVYVVYGPATAYVGESSDVLKRTPVRLAHLLAWPWTVARYMPTSTKTDRLRAEHAVAMAYRAAGYRLASLTAPEIARLAGAAVQDSAIARENGRRGLAARWAKETPAERSAYMRWLNSKQTHAQRVAAGTRGAMVRWHPERLPQQEQ